MKFSFTSHHQSALTKYITHTLISISNSCIRIIYLHMSLLGLNLVFFLLTLNIVFCFKSFVRNGVTMVINLSATLTVLLDKGIQTIQSKLVSLCCSDSAIW